MIAVHFLKRKLNNYVNKIGQIFISFITQLKLIDLNQNNTLGESYKHITNLQKIIYWEME